MKIKLKYSKPIVTFFLAMAVFAVLAAFVTIIINNRVFEKKFHFRAKFTDAGGLKNNTPVVLKGFKVGYIENISLSKDNFVEADLSIYNEFRDKVTQNSLLYKSFAIIGAGTTIEFIPGRKGNQILKEGELVPAVDVPEGVAIRREHPFTFQGDPVTTFMFRVERFLEEFNPGSDIPEENQQRPLQTTLKSIMEVTQRVKNITHNLDTILSVVSLGLSQHGNALFNSFDKLPTITNNASAISVDMVETIKKTNALLENYKKPDSIAIKAIDPTGEMFLKPLSKTLEEVNKLLPEINKLANYSNTQTTNVSVLIEKLKSVLAELDITFENLNKSPILGNPDRKENNKYNNDQLRKKEIK